MTETECKVAIIGAGNMAKEHARAFRDVPGVKIVGIHSRTRSKAKALADEFHIEQIFDSISELYNQTHADLVVVTVFEMAMNSVSRECFEYPWTVLLEKPPDIILTDAIEIKDAAIRKKRNVLVALNRRFLSSTRSVRQDILNTSKTIFIKIRDQEDQNNALLNGQPEPVVNNWMYANSIHMIDFFQIFGRAKVTVVEPIIPWTPKRSNVVISRLEYENGDLGLYEGIWNGPGPWAVDVFSAEKLWELKPVEQASVQLQNQRTAERLPVHPWDIRYKPGFRLQAEMAVKSTLGERSESPTLDDSMMTMRIIEAIFSREKKEIVLS